jgi:hypothetical protein
VGDAVAAGIGLGGVVVGVLLDFGLGAVRERRAEERARRRGELEELRRAIDRIEDRLLDQNTQRAIEATQGRTGGRG